MFDAKKFIRENFQSAGGVIAHCRSAGAEPPTDEQVQKWMQRNSVPGDWLAKLIAVLEKNGGEAVSLQPYMAPASQVLK